MKKVGSVEKKTRGGGEEEESIIVCEGVGTMQLSFKIRCVCFLRWMFVVYGYSVVLSA